MVVCGSGTGGTVSGIGRKLKEKVPQVKVVAVDALGSILAGPAYSNENVEAYDIEGLGYDFLPDVLGE